MRRTRAVLGIDLGATNLKVVAFDDEGHLVPFDSEGRESGCRVEPSGVELGPAATMRKLAGTAGSAIARLARRGYSVEAVGIGVCAPVRHRQGEIVESAVLPGWKDVPVAGPLSSALSLPVVVENDANAAIMGEWWRGSAQGASVVAGLTLGTGIGGGLVIDGAVFHGASGFAAEFGHIAVDSGGIPCQCGGNGCLGRVASITATLERYRELAAGRSDIGDIAGLAALAADGDAAAQQAIAASAGYVADAVLILVNCLNPAVVVLAGGMASSLGDRLLDPVAKRIRNGCYKCIGDEVRVVTATLGVFSGSYGAGYLALGLVGR